MSMPTQLAVIPNGGCRPALISETHSSTLPIPSVESQSQHSRCYQSDCFNACGNVWQLLWYHQGNSSNTHCSLYIALVGAANFKPRNCVFASVKFLLVGDAQTGTDMDQPGPKTLSKSFFGHKFSSQSVDWGFTVILFVIFIPHNLLDRNWFL
jgi:hypothetical protein